MGDGSYNIRINALNNQLVFQTAGITRVSIQDSTILLGSSVINMQWPSGSSSVNLSQLVSNTATATGGAFTVAAQDMSGTTSVTGGIMRLRAGNATAGSGIRNGGSVELLWGTGASGNGNISMGMAASSFQSMNGGLFLANCDSAPTGNPTSGGFLYESSGAFTHRGSAGTINSWAA
jgi:hypothetical protein